MKPHILEYSLLQHEYFGEELQCCLLNAHPFDML